MSYLCAPVCTKDAFVQPPGIRFEIAQSVRAVETAWNLVYHAYRAVGFIQSNPFALHACEQIVGDKTLVVTGRMADVPVNTITAVGDGPHGIPLDAVYHKELNGLRRQGRRMMEIGMFADRRPEEDASFHSLLELMRYTFWFGAYLNITDYICGIPPHRVRLYQAAFGFKPVADTRTYACVDGNPVQMMRADVEYVRQHHARHRATGYFMQNPLDMDVFHRRFSFAPAAMAMSRLETFMTYKNSRVRSAAV